MNQQEKQKRFEFAEDFISLAKDYGWTPDQAMDILGFKQKTTNDLLLEQVFEEAINEVIKSRNNNIN